MCIKNIMLAAVAFMAIATSTVTLADAKGTVSGLAQLNNGSNIFFFTVSGATYASCAKSGRYAIDISTVAGKAIMAQVLAFYLSRTNFNVGSTGTCITEATSENAWIIYLP